MDEEEKVIFEIEVIKSIKDLNREEKERFKQLEEENREYDKPFRINYIPKFKKRIAKRIGNLIRGKILGRKFIERPALYFGKHEIHLVPCIEGDENINFDADVKHIKRKNPEEDALTKFIYHDKISEYGYVFTHDLPCNIPINPSIDLSLKKQKHMFDLSMRDIGTATVRDATMGLKRGDKYIQGLVLGGIVLGFLLGVIIPGFL